MGNSSRRSEIPHRCHVIEAYTEAERMGREVDWQWKARRCTHPVWICYAIVVGLWAMVEVFRVLFG
jgi:hypothetical protein